ncbi:N-(5'-phosphoribosyl)anthranilate isomerase [Streptomyces sp. AK02-01A]|uniref:phosphoribosylanthranilate isomerase n=1 Tax=Streptomyces sp. AK02-01A TaxID=3028648 RepID=UPI0029BAC04F|nr:N-(5'-phosphoribosyl)anthranilate isomerase [Streptomyces sp. AK02-01A]MDX3850056.1 N-(5'-phosphoribosyl)anthranilate isomerase [Streptomyces sp. AK02-01A]
MSPESGSRLPAGRSAAPEARRVLKVCGATAPDDITTLAGAGADCVGLWHGIPGGHAELPELRLTELAEAALGTGLEPVLVTFLADPEALSRLARRTGLRWLQLHAYQPPAVVRALRAALPDAVLVKVLHLRGGGCLERPLIGAYERAGTDMYLLDTATEDGRIGSTGRPLSERDVLTLLPGLGRPFLLAGGISPYNRTDFEAVAGHPGFRGIDVDTAARDGHGRISAPAVTALARAWRTATSSEESI